jgi:Na+-transporting methylmalonyl-CoA/oxaloacetate decarboxylase beta subunit
MPLAPLTGKGELINLFYHYGLECEVIPCLIFLGIGALTDFGPMIANPKNFLLMHTMGPNVAGVIGTAIAAGMFLTMLK